MDLNKHYFHEALQKPYHLYHSKLMIIETYSIFFINLCIKTDLYLKFNVKYRFQGCTKLSNFLYTVKSCFSTFLSVLECLICEFSWQFFKRHTTDVDLCTSAIMIVKIVYFIVFFMLRQVRVHFANCSLKFSRFWLIIESQAGNFGTQYSIRAPLKCAHIRLSHSSSIVRYQ